MSPIDPTAIPTNHRGTRRSDMSLTGWLLFSNSIFFVTSALALVASITVFLLTRANDRAKDRELEAYQAKAQTEIAQTKADAARANEHVASLELKIEEAREANLKLEHIVEEERARRVTIEQGLSPRHLTPEQTVSITNELRGQNFSVSFELTSSAEVFEYGGELYTAVRNSGVQTSYVSGVYLGNTPTGLKVIIPTDNHPLLIAFQHAGVDLTWSVVPFTDVKVIVGEKPLPFR